MGSLTTSDNKLPGVLYSHVDARKVVDEQFIVEHGLCIVISGVFKVADAGENKSFHAGDMIFFRKNFLAKFIKQPLEDQDFKSITVILDRNTLMEFSRQHGYQYEHPYTSGHAVLKLAPNILLENFFNTLGYYFDTSLPERLVDLKKQEALMLLLQEHPELKNVLFDFELPGKIDLEAFMQQNFMYNVNMEKLAFLTGRSLATFKRDFRKVFGTSPNRWLQQRRLEEAHYLIKEENRRPSDVYHEVGFESLSHFSYSFKQFYGVNPSSLQ
ncbi:helix-turn-helix domain-containing protein [Chitinophaga filiformis]|uniref:AraC family transcriptional regulator n=1 Tax=Chitinophaga filiformis TaxID=104663 RepID=A0ABY4I6C6_CHIFI|nr:AraC family transcriptional regulator [Chitinophaga filiformis]UPK70276.1 AraC family transcriptional regulator [Chitinophaga filiformis]